MATSKQKWDPELYEARHAFVWQFGENLIDLLDPQPGERILDLGCGPGQLTQKIAERGASVSGLDASPDMIGQARQNYPHLPFALQDGVTMTYEGEFDAIFSNAVLHWITQPKAICQAMARALKPGGRVVAELGGKGNVSLIQHAVETVLGRYLETVPARSPFFPGIVEYGSFLEAAGLELTFARLYHRPTPLEGENGMENWLRQFEMYRFERIPAQHRDQAIREAVDLLRPSLYKDAGWVADYRRLCFVAVK